MTDPQDTPRLASEADLPALRQIVRAAYAKYLTRMDRAPGPMVRDMQPQVDAGHVWTVGQPISALICLFPQDESLLIENVAVHPSVQGTGLGRHLMEFAEDEARRRGFSCLRLYTNEIMTENLAIYDHLGYHEVERRSEDGYRRVFLEKYLRLS